MPLGLFHLTFEAFCVAVKGVLHAMKSVNFLVWLMPFFVHFRRTVGKILLGEFRRSQVEQIRHDVRGFNNCEIIEKPEF